MAIITTILTALILLPLAAGILSLLCSGFSKSLNGIPYKGLKGPAPYRTGLLFHAVTTDKRNGLSRISGEKFREFLDLLQRNSYKGVSIRDYNRSSQEIPLTFDDSLENIYSEALPVLSRYPFSATLFVITDYIGKESNWSVYSRTKHMNVKQIQETADKGYEIGSHTHTHADLRYLSKNRLRKELRTSKSILEDITGMPVYSISFPYGSWNLGILHEALECGYERASAYRFHNTLHPMVVPLKGVYSFDRPEDILLRAENTKPFSCSSVQGKIMPRFASGSPLWKYREEYSIKNFLSNIT